MNAKEMGRKGGHARAARLSPERRIESARKAARARWRAYRKAKRAAARDAKATSLVESWQVGDGSGDRTVTVRLRAAGQQRQRKAKRAAKVA